MSVFLTIFLGLFFVAGLAVAITGMPTIWKDYVSGSWPQTPGRIIRAEVTDNSGQATEDHGVTYTPTVVYTYKVNGREFTGHRISFGASDGGGGLQEVAQRHIDRYPVGTSAPVWYRQDQPEVSVLESGLNKRSFTRVAFGLMFVWFAVWFRLVCWLAM